MFFLIRVSWGCFLFLFCFKGLLLFVCVFFSYVFFFPLGLLGFLGVDRGCFYASLGFFRGIPCFFQRIFYGFLVASRKWSPSGPASVFH